MDDHRRYHLMLRRRCGQRNAANHQQRHNDYFLQNAKTLLLDLDKKTTHFDHPEEV
jgi:hypothetical protein